MNLNASHTDSDLISLLHEGNKHAFKMLFDRYGNRLYQFSVKYLKDKQDAEDLLSEVFLKIWENRANLRTNSSFQAYLFTIAYNNIRQRFLKRYREEKYVRLFAEEYLLDAGKQDDELDFQLFSKTVNELIDLLPPRRKEIFLLSYKEEKKIGEIALQLELSEQFIKKQLSLARRFIISKVKEDNTLSGLLLLYLFSRIQSI